MWRQRAAASLLGHRDFRLLWGGETVSELGSQVSELALPLVAVLTLRASTFQVGLLTAAGTAAFLLMGLPAGAWVDRVRRRPVMIAADLGRAVALGSVPVAAALGVLRLPQLYAVTLLAGTLTVFFDVAYQSYLPALVGRQRLVEGNAKLAGSQEAARVAGPSLSGGLVQAVGGPVAIVADAVSFLASAGALARINLVEAAPERQESRRLHREIGEGLRFVLGHPILRAIAGTTATSNFFSAVFAAVAVVFLVRGLHQAPGVIGLLFAAGSVGGVTGAVLASGLARRLGGSRSILAGAAVSGLGLLLVPLTRPGPGLVLFAVGVFVVSFGGVVYNVNQVSFRQGLCPAHLLGRMNATMRFLVWGTLPLGGVAGGALGATIGLRPTLWVAAGGSILACAWVLASPLSTMRDLPGHPSPDPSG